MFWVTTSSCMPSEGSHDCVSTQIGYHNSTPSRVRGASSTSTARSSQILLRLLIFRKSAERGRSVKPQTSSSNIDLHRVDEPVNRTEHGLWSGSLVILSPNAVFQLHTLMQHSVCNFWVLPSLLQQFPLCGSFSFSFAST